MKIARLTFIALVCTASLFVTAPAAFGFSTPVFEGEFGYEGSGEGGLNQPRDVAVGTEGDLWVADTGNDRIQHFDSEGKYLGQVGEAGYWEGALSEPAAVAVDSAGDLWVADTGNSRVQEFSPEGEYLQQFEFFGRPMGLAFDPEGKLWVSFFVDSLPTYSSVIKYDVEGQPEILTGSFEPLAPRGMDTDDDGNLWVAEPSTSRIQQYSPEGELLFQFGEAGYWEGALAEPASVAVDPAGDLLVADSGNNRIQAFSPEGEYLGQFGEEGFWEGAMLEPTGIAADSTGDLWIADKGNSRIQRWWVEPPTPTAVTGAATGVGATSATLNGTVNANGAWTLYQFEYGTTTAYGESGPGDIIEEGVESKEVGGEITGLEPATTYHFRIVTLNEFGVSYGGDRTFTTLAGPPAATTEAATDVMAEEATLHAIVNPKGAATNYQFEYGATTAYGSKVPTSAKPAGSGAVGVAVEEALEGLTEGTTYHYRVVAASEAGTTYGEDVEFATSLLPEADTEEAEAVEGVEAVLTGSVDPNGASTEYNFEYGTTPAYGTAIAPDGAGDGTNAIDASEAIGELEPETTYHYRLVATSQAGTDYGEDKTFTTGAASGSGGGTPLPGDFFGMQWTGDLGQTAYPHVLGAVKHSGARMMRLALRTGANLQTKYEEIFRGASHRGITILPHIGDGVWPTDPGQQDALKQFAKEMVEKYGPGGSFWNGGGHPAVVWEIWNEPNLPTNSPFPDPPDLDAESAPYEKIGAEQFGNFFHKIAEGLKEGAGAQSIEILAPSLFGFNSSNCDNGNCHLSPANFLGQMKHESDYSAAGLHPYVFKVKGQSGIPHAPTGPNQVAEVNEKVENLIRGLRNRLNTLNGSTKKIWITELGFPVEYPNENPTFPSVSDEVQKEEIEVTFAMMRDKRDALRIAHAFYYNIQDFRCSQFFVEIGVNVCPSEGIELETWDYHTGLRKGKGGNRLGWRGFTAVAPQGHPNWPPKSKAKNASISAQPLQATSSYAIDTEGSKFLTRLDWGAGPSSSEYPQHTNWQVVETQDEGEGAEEPVEVAASTTLPNLLPATTYHYRIAAMNENGEVEVTADKEFTTPPSSDTGATVKQTLNGEPGWVSVGGYIHEGAEEGTVGPPIAGAWLNVNFQKKENGEWVTKSTDHPVTDSEGYYETQNWSVGKGEWQVRTVFPPQLGYQESKSAYHGFTIKNGYQLVAKHSGKCLDVSNSNTANGAALVQWECNSPQTAQNQVFKLVPQGNSYYQLVARHSNRCIDVPGASQTQGVTLQQYDCLGAGQTNQIWQGVPVETIGGNDYVHFVAKHSGQCMEVQSSSNANGAPVGQWPCNGNQANQLWTFKSVESNDIETHTYLTPGERLNGHPGYQSVSGSVDLGAYSTAGKWVNVNFSKEVSPGNYQYVSTIDPHPTLNAAGQYSYNWWGVGTGNWRVRTVFPGEGALASSESNYHYFHIGDGYRFKFRHSGRCLSTSGGGTSNGTPLIQWDCSPSPNPNDGQVYSVVPQGGGYWQIKPDSNTNKCVDVTGVSQSNGAKLQLWDCLGAGQTNQIWNIIPISGQPGWFASIAKHSNKCMDVYGAQTGNGAIVHQWDCHWGGNQQWEWQSIG